MGDTAVTEAPTVGWLDAFLPIDATAVSLALGIALAFFLGLAFEEAYASSKRSRPGGIRTFPLLAIAGFLFYALEPAHGLVFVAGLVVIGLWLHADYRAALASDPDGSARSAEIVIPLCNLLAYALGPIARVAPPWLAVGVAVAAVLMLNARDWLHALPQRIPVGEITTLGKFLVLIGVVLPLLPDVPVTPATPITPRQVWLAVVVVSSVSYGSYLIQRAVPNRRGVLVAAVLGGLYSSTVTTFVLCRACREGRLARNEFNAGVLVATAMMYPRVLIVIAAFDPHIAYLAATSLVGLFLLGGTMTLGFLQLDRTPPSSPGPLDPQRNPLEIGAAIVFAVLFVGISLLSSVVENHFGQGGLYAMAAIVGVTDIDPFVLSLVQGSVQGLGTAPTVAAILVAASSNNVLKAGVALLSGGPRTAWPALAGELVLAAVGIGLAWRMIVA
jgi:uncharacterized membrane protein (DUF4010 family)